MDTMKDDSPVRIVLHVSHRFGGWTGDEELPFEPIRWISCGGHCRAPTLRRRRSRM